MKVLVVGGGSIGKRHIKNILSLGFNEVFCLKRTTDPDFSKETGAEVVTNFDEALQRNVESVFVCTPTALHMEALTFAVVNNLPVFMEKPLIHSKDGLAQAKNILKDFQNVFFIGFMLRFHPLVQKIKELLSSQAIGDIYSARFEFGSYLPNWHPYEDYRTGYAAMRRLGGGVINTITHELDLIQYFFGTPKHVTCLAQNLGVLEIDVEEQCEAIFEYENLMVSLHLDFLQKDYDRNIKILGTDGKIQWNWHDDYLTIKKTQKEAERIHLEKSYDVNQMYLDEVESFFNLIEKSSLNHSLNAKHAISNTELLLKMHDSSKQYLKVRTDEKG